MQNKYLNQLGIFIFISILCLFSCRDNTQAIKGNNNDSNEIIISDKVTIHKTILEEKSEIKLNKNNLDSIAIEYVGNYEDFVSTYLVEKKGDESYFLVAFNEDNVTKIHAVSKNRNGNWKPFSKTKLPELLNFYKQGDFFVKEEQFIISETCVPRYCDVTFGFYMFNTNNKKAYGIFQGLENGLSIPHNLPNELIELSSIERKIYEHLPFNVNEYFIYGILNDMISKLPKRNLVNLKEILPRKVFNKLIKTCKLSQDYRVHSIFLEDFDGDDELEWMIFAENLNYRNGEGEFKSYLIQIGKSNIVGNRAFDDLQDPIEIEFNNDFLLSGIFELNILKNIDQPPFILASSFQGRERWFYGEIFQCFDDYCKTLDIGPQEPSEEASAFFNKVCKKFYTNCCNCPN